MSLAAKQCSDPKQPVNLCLLSLQWFSAGVHDRHHNRVHAALPQAGAYSKTLPRYHTFASFLCVLVYTYSSLRQLACFHLHLHFKSVLATLVQQDLKLQVPLVIELPHRTITFCQSLCESQNVFSSSRFHFPKNDFSYKLCKLVNPSIHVLLFISSRLR